MGRNGRETSTSFSWDIHPGSLQLSGGTPDYHEVSMQKEERGVDGKRGAGERDRGWQGGREKLGKAAYLIILGC